MRVMFFCFLMAILGDATANDYTLKGRILAYGANGEEVPLSDVQLSILYRNIEPSVTNSEGEFTLSFDKYRSKGRVTLSGRKVKLVINDSGWVIAYPYGGEFFLPKDLDNEPLIVRVVANNSTISIGPLNAKFSAKNPIDRDSAPRYTVQVFYTSNGGKATAIINHLQSRGYDPFITDIFNKDTRQYVYAISAGRFISYDEAQRNRVVLMHNGYPGSFVKPLSK